MASSRLREIQKTERLRAIYDARKDKQGEPKQIYVYEVLKFNIQQKNRMIHKKYYKLIHIEPYNFTSIYDEIMLSRKVRERVEKITPFMLDIQLKRLDENDPLIEYYNEQSQPYFDMVYTNGDYVRKKNTLDVLRHKRMDDTNNLIDFMMNLSFDV